jgi:hypothetical protein
VWRMLPFATMLGSWKDCRACYFSTDQRFGDLSFSCCLRPHVRHRVLAISAQKCKAGSWCRCIPEWRTSFGSISLNYSRIPIIGFNDLAWLINTWYCMVFSLVPSQSSQIATGRQTMAMDLRLKQQETNVCIHVCICIYIYTYIIIVYIYI